MNSVESTDSMRRTSLELVERQYTQMQINEIQKQKELDEALDKVRRLENKLRTEQELGKQKVMALIKSNNLFKKEVQSLKHDLKQQDVCLNQLRKLIDN